MSVVNVIGWVIGGGVAVFVVSVTGLALRDVFRDNAAHRAAQAERYHRRDLARERDL